MCGHTRSLFAFYMDTTASVLTCVLLVLKKHAVRKFSQSQQRAPLQTKAAIAASCWEDSVDDSILQQTSARTCRGLQLVVARPVPLDMVPYVGYWPCQIGM